MGSALILPYSFTDLHLCILFYFSLNTSSLFLQSHSLALSLVIIIDQVHLTLLIKSHWLWAAYQQYHGGHHIGVLRTERACGHGKQFWVVFIRISGAERCSYIFKMWCFLWTQQMVYYDHDSTLIHSEPIEGLFNLGLVMKGSLGNPAFTPYSTILITHCHLCVAFTHISFHNLCYRSLTQPPILSVFY